MADTVTIKYNLTANMLFSGHWAINRRRTSVVGLFMLVATVTLLIVDWKSKNLGAAAFLLAVGWLLLAYRYILRPWFAYKAFAKEPNLAGGVEVTAARDGIRMKSAKGESRSAWSAFPAFLERPELFVLRLGKKQMIVIPKSAFTSEDDLAKFRQILASNIRAAR